MRTLKQVLDSMSDEHKFSFLLPANTTTEVWHDINTGLDDGEAWYVSAIMWDYMSETAGSNPLRPHIAAGITHELQLVRDLDAEELLPINEKDLVLRGAFTAGYETNGGIFYRHPFRSDPLEHGILTQTRARLIHRTNVNNTNLANTRVVGKIFYEPFSIPKKFDHTKLGRSRNL